MVQSSHLMKAIRLSCIIRIFKFTIEGVKMSISGYLVMYFSVADITQRVAMEGQNFMFQLFSEIILTLYERMTMTRMKFSNTGYWPSIKYFLNSKKICSNVMPINILKSVFRRPALASFCYSTKAINSGGDSVSSWSNGFSKRDFNIFIIFNS